MIIGLARQAQHEEPELLELQLRELDAAQAKKVFSVSGSTRDLRKQRDAAIAFSREGDLFVVTSLDRISDSIPDLCHTLGVLTQKSVDISVIDIGLDTRTAEGAAMLRVFVGLTRFSKQTRAEHQREGIELARLGGRYKGRKPTARAKTPEVLNAYRLGRTIAQIVRDTGMGRASVYRILEANGMWQTQKHPGRVSAPGVVRLVD